MDSLRDLNALNKQFCEGALEYSYQIVKQPRVLNPQGIPDTYWTAHKTEIPDITSDIAVHRALKYRDNVRLLFVIDLDYYGRDPIETTLEAADRANEAFPHTFFAKFSGNKGIHLASMIDRKTSEWLEHADERKPFNLPDRTPEQNIQDYFLHVVKGVEKHVSGLTIDKEKAERNDLVWMDVNMYVSNKLIRGICMNFSGGMYSVPINLKRDDVDRILEKAKLQAGPGIREIRIPPFNLYDLADPKDDVKERIPKKLDEKRFTEIDDRFRAAGGVGEAPKLRKIELSQADPCVKKILSIAPPYHPRYDEMRYLVCWLNRHNYGKEEIHGIVREMMGDKYDERVSNYQINYYVDKNLPYASCKRVKDEYGLCDPKCRWYKKNFEKK